MAYAEILMDIHTRQLDRLFTYSLPDGLYHAVRPGSKVLVSFRNRKETGYIVRIVEEAGYAGKVLPVLEVVDQDVSLSPELMILAEWLADHSFVSRAKAYATVFPTLSIGRIDREKSSLTITDKGIRKKEEMRQCPSRDALYVLDERGRMDWTVLARELQLTRGILDRLIREELVSLHPALPGKFPPDDKALSPRQMEITQQIALSVKSREQGQFLLFGVTGSGKTEIYMELIKTCLERGRQALVLLPEIALTEEMIERYRRVFGDQVMAWHSRITPARKKLVWERLHSGEAGVLLGARSAIFTGMQDLGLIIVDEEHEASFRQSTAPAYDGREVARLRGQLNDAVVVFGSATPSTETWYRMLAGEMTLLQLEDRFGEMALPHIQVVDMRHELRRGNYSPFSRALTDGIVDCLGEKKQVLLFLNRRGYSGAFVCRSCGHTMMCEHCEIPLTYHRVGDQLKCHYCGYSINAVQNCPECGSTKIRTFGTGTQKVEKALKERFPEARIARIDADVSDAQGYRRSLIQDLKSGRTDILIGTQMIVKGIDFPNVGLVAVLAADLGLNIPDFRAREKTCQQLIQVAGRAGRTDGKGRCLIQTYQPGNPAVKFGRESLYQEFLDLELAERKKMNYPPYRHSVRILFLSEKPKDAAHSAQQFATFLRKEIPDFLGPVPAAYVKIKGMYRWHIIAMGPSLAVLKKSIHRTLEKYERDEGCSGVLLNVEINPGSML